MTEHENLDDSRITIRPLEAEKLQKVQNEIDNAESRLQQYGELQAELQDEIEGDDMRAAAVATLTRDAILQPRVDRAYRLAENRQKALEDLHALVDGLSVTEPAARALESLVPEDVEIIAAVTKPNSPAIPSLVVYVEGHGDVGGSWRLVVSWSAPSHWAKLDDREVVVALSNAGFAFASEHYSAPSPLGNRDIIPPRVQVLDRGDGFEQTINFTAVYAKKSKDANDARDLARQRERLEALRSGDFHGAMTL